MINKNLSSKFTKRISYLLDNFLPPIIRDSKWFYSSIIRLWNPKFDIDFKEKAPFMTNYEFQKAYEDISPMRSTDNTKATLDFVFENIHNKKVLEIGAGNGDVSFMCSRKGYEITATDISMNNIEIIKKKSIQQKLRLNTVVANVENLPFENNSFDTVVCLHVIEHVRDLFSAIAELKRVTRKCIIIIVPKQRYFRYTADYHLNFFLNQFQLVALVGIKKFKYEIIDNCICYCGDLMPKN